ncbi:MAG: DUF1489 domain-containing protein [Alphaproteobacteria bacterium]|nr:DUF1489 domain-containing protein [Alphaproteobacteria bacterium]
MTLHLVKLCVGAESIESLAAWQEGRLKDLRKKGKKPELVHVTRMTPKRAEELLDGGSLYWVIKGYISVRQRLIDLRPVVKNGRPHCGLVYDRQLVATSRRFCRPFQGWRYLEEKNAPADIAALKGVKNLPEKLKAELADLGLL